MYYCPFCGTEHDQIIKPKTCERCGKDFASAFKVSTPEPVVKAKVAAKKPSHFKRAKPATEAVASKPMTVVGEEEPPTDAPPEEEIEDDDAPDTDPDEVAQLAGEIRASINENDIIIDMGEEPQRLMSWIRQPK